MHERLLAGAALAVGALSLWAAPASASPNGDTAMLIGDSLAQSITDETGAVLADEGWNLIALGVGGTGLTEGTPARQLGATFDWPTQLSSMEAAYDPDVVLIVLGTNDVFSVEQGEDYVPQVERLLGATDAPGVYWADIASHTSDLARNAAAESINAAIEGEDRVTVLPYDDTISTVPENLDTDGLHMSAAGQAAFASLIAQFTGPAPTLALASK